MKRYIKILEKSKLFTNMGECEIYKILSCLQAKLLTYKKGEHIFKAGEHISQITILVDGKLLIQQDDFWGNRSIINAIQPGEMFAEAYVSPDSEAILNNVIAEKDSTIISFDIDKLLSVCPLACEFHSAVVKNLLFAISEKNRILVQKIGHISKRSIRAKLLSYLSDEAKRKNSSSFTIPFNRQQLADFLSVDRSAMSNELCKMRNDGLLKFDKNHFTLL